MITTSTGAKKIEGTDNWREIFDAHNDSVDAYDSNIVELNSNLTKVETIKQQPLSGTTDANGNIAIGISPLINNKGTIVLCFCQTYGQGYNGVYTTFWNGSGWYVHVTNWNGQAVAGQSISGVYYYGTYSV